MKCEIVENYSDYSPPYPIVPVVKDLLRCVKPAYIEGLASIVIVDSSSLSRQERRHRVKSRNHKVHLATRSGFYQPASRDQAAYIQLKANMIISKRMLKSLNCFTAPLLLRIVFALALYHEIGHHIHTTKIRENRFIENVADKYMYQLLRRMIFKRWYLVPIAFLGIIPAYLRLFNKNVD